VNWQFDRMPDNGFVMQKIERHEETPTGEKINPETFWEFWPVSKYARGTNLQRELRIHPRITKPGEDPHTPDDTLGQDRRLGVPSRAGNRMVIHSEASLWVGEKIPDAAKISPRSSARDLRIMTTDPGLMPDPALSIRRGYTQPLR